MSVAVGYRRLSDKDQSNSLETQEKGIRQFATNNNLSLAKMFTDNGTSAFTFDRPEWKKLEAYIKENKQVRYIIIYHIDRFSRATLLDALMKLNEVEKRLNVKVRAVTDTLVQNDDDVSSQLVRVMQLMFSNNEYNRIKQRVNDGIYNSLTKGRYCNKAPIGYKSANLTKDERRKNDTLPLIIIDPEKAPLIREVFSLYNSGLSLIDVKRLMPKLKLESKSGIQRILSNPTYAGIVVVPERNGVKSFEVNGIHEPIVSKFDYYKAISRLNKRKNTTQKTDEFWLRGVLYCECGRLLTAANSKGKAGKLYGYYKCNTHLKNNYPSKKVHAQFLAILNEISFDATETAYIESELKKRITDYQNKKGGMIMQLNLDKAKTEQRIKNVTEKYLTTENIDKSVFDKSINELKSTLYEIETSLIKAKTDTDTMLSIVEQLLPKLNNLGEIFIELPLFRKHQLINLIFPFPLWYDGFYRTPKLSSLYAHKELILREKGLLFFEQPSSIFGEVPISTLNDTFIEHLKDLLNVLVA